MKALVLNPLKWKGKIQKPGVTIEVTPTQFKNINKLGPVLIEVKEVEVKDVPVKKTATKKIPPKKSPPKKKSPSKKK